jgi:hypothetical protein
MEIVINKQLLIQFKLDPNSLVLLYLLYKKDFDSIKDIFGKDKAISIRNSLINTNYILSSIDTKFTDTIISNNHVEKLLGLRGDNINFWEFYNCYPIKIGSRILRASGSSSKKAIKHEKQYLNRVKTIEDHKEAIQSITAYVAKKKSEGKLQYLEMMDTVMNNCLWEDWKVFIKEEESKNWNYDNA